MADTVVVDNVEIEYDDTGSGPPLVFVHGVYVTGELWADVTARLSGAHRCIVPTWPFGAQRKPVGAGVDIGVEAAGRRILKLLEVLDLSNVTLMANEHFPGWSFAEVANRVNQSANNATLASASHFPSRMMAKSGQADTSSRVRCSSSD